MLISVIKSAENFTRQLLKSALKWGNPEHAGVNLNKVG